MMKAVGIIHRSFILPINLILDQIGEPSIRPRHFVLDNCCVYVVSCGHFCQRGLPTGSYVEMYDVFRFLTIHIQRMRAVQWLYFSQY